MQSETTSSIQARHTIRTPACALVIGLSCLLACISPSAKAASHSPQTFTVDIKPSNIPLRAIHQVGPVQIGQTYGAFQDRQGYIWLGTGNGVVRYDGTQAVNYTHDGRNPRSLGADIVRGITQSSSDAIWLGTYGGGLDRYDAATDDFTPYLHKDDDPSSLASNKIWSLASGRDGTIWVGTFDKGLDQFDPKTGKFTHYQHDNTNPDSLADNRVNCIFRDSEGRLWICTETGLDLWLGRERGFKHFSGALEERQHGNGPVHVWSVAEDKTHQLWVVTDDEISIFDSDLKPTRRIKFAAKGKPDDTQFPQHLRQILIDTSGHAWVSSMNGVYEIDTRTHTAYQFRHKAWNTNSLLNNMVWCVLQDRTGLLWFGTYTGVDTLDPRAMLLTYITATPDKSGLADAEGTVIEIESKRYAWAASQYAVQRIDLASDTVVQRYQHVEGDPNSLARGIIEPIYWSPRGYLWVGTTMGGLDRIAPKNHAVTHFASDTARAPKLSSQELTSITEDRDGTLWIGTFTDGLYAMDTKTGRYLPRWWNDLLDRALEKARIQYVAMDKMGRIWISIHTAVFVLDLNRRTLIRIRLPHDEDPRNTGNLIVYDCMLQDQFLVNTTEDVVSIPIMADGTIGSPHPLHTPFHQQGTAALYETVDNKGRIWFGTYNGIYRYDPTDGQYAHFSHSQGLPIKIVYYIKKLPDGRLMAQGGTGLIIFNSDELKPHTMAPHILVTSVRAYRKDRIINSQLLSKQLTIPPDEVTTTLHFSVFDFRDPSTLHYRYRMLGLSDTWIDSGPTNSATYTNLSPGNYTFEVLGADADGVWTPSASKVAVTVLPPWWRTWWAYLLYSLFLISLATAYVLRQRKKLEHERAISTQLREADALKSEFVEKLKQEVASATSDLRYALEAMRIKNVELDEANQRALDASRIKSEFLSNMSHEIRTPMSGILGFLELLERTRLKPEQSGYLDAIRHSADSLLGIIDDILDLSRIEAGKLALDETAFNPREVIEGVLELLAPIAYDKNLELVCNNELPADIVLRGDPLRLRQVLVNLVGNAVKYTNKGTVSLNASVGRETEAGFVLHVAVTDTGIGIAAEQQENLFQAFNRGGMDMTRRYRGTGLGLSICKMLMDAMHGEIHLHSTPGIGSTFEISIELPREYRSAPSPDARPLNGHTAVVYDSNPVARRALVSALEHLGMNTAEATEPEALITEARGAQGSGSAVDIVVVGLGPNVERDLEAIADALAARPPDLPTLALVSTMRHALLREIGDALGVDARPKTLRLERLNEIICSLLKLEPAGGVRERPRVSARTTPELGTLLNGIRILVTDDNRINRTLLVKMLTQAGAEVEESANGHDAIEKTKTAEFDAILMDIHMPGLSGIEVTQAIRRRNGNMAIIGVSANALPETRKTAIAAGIDDYLVKPVREAALIETVLRCVQARKESPAGPTDQISD